MKKFIGKVDATPKLLTYFKCWCEKFDGTTELVNIKIKGAAQNLLTLGLKYKSITFGENYIDEAEYDKLTFTEYN